MNNLKTISEEVSANTIDNNYFDRLVCELYQINQVTTFPVSDKNLEAWGNSIIELAPELTPEILKKIINKYKTGYYQWDNKVGLPNIFKGYHQLILEKIEWLARIDQFKNEKEIDKLDFIVKKLFPRKSNAYSSGVING